jgi:2-dehydropantoate 2-reductase
LFQRLFARMLTVDPLARSSMLDDLDSGRRTEVDWLCGEVVRLAQSLQRKAPVNARLAELVHAAESGGQCDWPAAALLAELLAAAS